MVQHELEAIFIGDKQCLDSIRMKYPAYLWGAHLTESGDLASRFVASNRKDVVLLEPHLQPATGSSTEFIPCAPKSSCCSLSLRPLR